MARQKQHDDREVAADVAAVVDRIRPPVLVILGSPHEVGILVAQLKCPEIVCYQMDLYQADRLEHELGTAGHAETRPWLRAWLPVRRARSQSIPRLV